MVLVIDTGAVVGDDGVGHGEVDAGAGGGGQGVVGAGGGGHGEVDSGCTGVVFSQDSHGVVG